MSDLETDDIVCLVCQQKLGKTRCHYGGVTCYSCRAFFRRNTQRSELPVCKSDGGCPITTTVRKQCAACRYQKCLSIGMKPELVLDDEEKKTRFRKFLSKKAQDSDSLVRMGRGGDGEGGRGPSRRRKESRMEEEYPAVEIKTETPGEDSCVYQYPEDGRNSDYYEGSQHYETYMENFIKKESDSPEHYNSLREESLIQINPDDIRDIFSSGTSVIKHKLDLSKLSRLGPSEAGEDHLTERQRLQPLQLPSPPPAPPAPPPEPVKRKSVIVRAGTLSRQPDPEEPNINEVISSALSLFPDDNEMLKTLEAEQSRDPLVNIVNCWNQKWNEVSYDPGVISEYATFCRTRQHFPLSFYNNNIIRERCLNFLTALEDYQMLGSEERRLLVHNNLDKAEMLVYVHVFNQPTWQEELEFLFGTENKHNWKFFSTEVMGVPLSTMITCMPISELNKLDIYRTFASCKPQDGLLADRVVFILSWILVSTEDEGLQPSPQLVSFREKTHSLLMSYLHQHRGPDVQLDLATIYNAIKILPRIGQVFATMRETVC